MSTLLVASLYNLGTDRIENAVSKNLLRPLPLPWMRIYRAVTKQWLSVSVIMSPYYQ
jgi:hypothetical protein